METRYAPLAVACALMMVGNIHAASLVTNGSFETGDLTGWDVLSGTVDVRSDYGTTDGTFAAVLGFGNGAAPNFELAQTISTTLGAAYTVEFDWAAAPNALPQTMLFEVNGVSGNLVSSSGFSQVGATPTPFNHFSFNFVADGASATLKFTDTSSSSVIIDQALDGVSMAAVPEPGNYALMLVGLSAMGLMAKRREA